MLVLLWAPAAMGQIKEKFDVSWHGWIGYDAYYDSRSMVSSRDGEIILFPMQERLDKDGVDLNGDPKLQMLGIDTRLQMKINGPEVLGAKTSGMVSGDFNGSATSVINHLRMRHAFMKLRWAHDELLVGQYWHPFFVPECFPQVMSAGAAVGYNPLSRMPQIRYTRYAGSWRLMAAVMTQRDFAGLGPDAQGNIVKSAEFMRNAGVPEGELQVQYHHHDSWIVGTTFGVRQIRPRMVTTTGYYTNERLTSVNANLFFTLKQPLFVLRAMAVWGENMAHLGVPGGYGVSAFGDQQQAVEEYANLYSVNYWVDVESNTRPLSVGLFAGNSAIVGAEKDIVGDVYASAEKMNNVMRLSPRVRYRQGPFQVGIEYIMMVATYGEPDSDFHYRNKKDVTGSRILLNVKYLF